MSFLRKQESRFIPAQAGTQAIGAFLFWVPAFAGMTRRAGLSTARGETESWIPACAGMTRKEGLSTARGEAGWFIRLKCSLLRNISAKWSGFIFPVWSDGRASRVRTRSVRPALGAYRTNLPPDRECSPALSRNGTLRRSAEEIRFQPALHLSLLSLSYPNGTPMSKRKKVTF